MYHEQNKKIHELSDAFSIESSGGSILRNVVFFFFCIHHKIHIHKPHQTFIRHDTEYEKKNILKFYCLGNMLKRDMSREN